MLMQLLEYLSLLGLILLLGKLVLNPIVMNVTHHHYHTEPLIRPVSEPQERAQELDEQSKKIIKQQTEVMSEFMKDMHDIMTGGDRPNGDDQGK